VPEHQRVDDEPPVSRLFKPRRVKIITLQGILGISSALRAKLSLLHARSRSREIQRVCLQAMQPCS
jgi:hypothetical protein